jgi:deoxyribodipyrimidine photo-lyase
MSTAKQNTFVHLHTLDLRVHDSPSLHLSHDQSSKLSSSITHFLPVYIFDERQLDISHLPGGASPGRARSDRPGVHQEDHPRYEPKHTRNAPLSRVGVFHRTSPHRLAFLVESVYALRETYRRSGGDMLIGYGRPEVLLPKLLESVEGSIAGVWAQREYSLEESRILDKVRDALPEGVKLNLNDSKTLIPPKHLPFDPKRATPDVYTAFRKQVEGMGLNLGGGMLVEPLQTASWDLDGKKAEKVVVSVGKDRTKLKPFPGFKAEGNGWVSGQSEIDAPEGMYVKLSKPLFANPPLGGWSSAVQEGQLPGTHQHSAIPFEGGENSALSRLEDYVGHGSGSNWQGGEKAKTYKDTRNGLIGDAFSTKFASFLSLGTLSAREAGWRVGELLELVGRDKDVRNNIYCESWSRLKLKEAPANSPFSATPGIIFELLWRDYFQFVVHQYAAVKPSSLFDATGFSSQISTYPADARPNVDEWVKPNLADKEDVARRWCEGRTGVPFIDAAMIELRETGYMSNRSRQNVASFLTKDL